MSKRPKLAIFVIVSVVVGSGAAGGIGFWQHHEQPQFCATCHIMEPYLESWKDTGLLANLHAQQGVTCLDCHEPTLQQQVHEVKAYLQGNFEVPLKERKFEMEFCFGCHKTNEHISYAQIIERTKDYLIDDQKINPHDPHPGIEGMEQHKCSSCHKIHKESPLINFCYMCHHNRTFASCSGCHQ